MKKFLILDQDQDPLIDTRWGEFTCGILELAGVYVVRVATARDSHSYTAAIFRDVQEAAEAVVKLKNFAVEVDEDNRAFSFPVPTIPVTALEVVDALS